MKKVLALVLALVMVFALCACGQQAAPAPAAEAPAAEAPAAEAPAAEAPADPMAELIAAAKAEGELVVYGSCEEEYLAAACAHFEELYGITPSNLDSSLCFFQSSISHDVLCI